MINLFNKYSLTAILFALMIVPFQFEIYYGNNHLIQYYGYGFILNPPTLNVPFFTTQILWSRVLIEITIILIITFFLTKRNTPQPRETIYYFIEIYTNQSLYLSSNNLTINKVGESFIFNFTCMNIDLNKNIKTISNFKVLPDNMEFQELSHQIIDIQTNTVILENKIPQPFSSYKVNSPIHKCIAFIINHPEVFKNK